MDKAFLAKLLDTERVTHDDKVNLFISAIPSFTKDSCKILLEELGLSELKESSTREKPENLHKVKNYRDDERNNDKFEVMKNKPRI